MSEFDTDRFIIAINIRHHALWDFESTHKFYIPLLILAINITSN